MLSAVKGVYLEEKTAGLAMNTYQSSFMPKFTEKEEKTSNRMNRRD